MKYTELFTEYIANNGGAENALPSLFDKVPNLTTDGEVTTFKDAFILNFCDREIGFETEELFALKLESRAKLVLPFYINKLKQLERIDYINAKRTETENRQINGTTIDGVQESNTRLKGENPLIDTDYSFNPKSVTEQEKNQSGYSKNTDSNGSENVTREFTDSGIEARDLYERILKDIMNVWNEIFKKFDSLFTQIW